MHHLFSYLFFEQKSICVLLEDCKIVSMSKAHKRENNTLYLIPQLRLQKYLIIPRSHVFIHIYIQGKHAQNRQNKSLISLLERTAHQ